MSLPWHEVEDWDDWSRPLGPVSFGERGHKLADPAMPRPRRAMRTAMMNSDVGAVDASIANAVRVTKANPAQRRQSAGNHTLGDTRVLSRWWGRRTTGTTAREATTRGKVAGRHESVDEPRQHAG